MRTHVLFLIILSYTIQIFKWFIIEQNIVLLTFFLHKAYIIIKKGGIIWDVFSVAVERISADNHVLVYADLVEEQDAVHVDRIVLGLVEGLLLVFLGVSKIDINKSQKWIDFLALILLQYLYYFFYYFCDIFILNFIK